MSQVAVKRCERFIAQPTAGLPCRVPKASVRSRAATVRLLLGGQVCVSLPLPSTHLYDVGLVGQLAHVHGLGGVGEAQVVGDGLGKMGHQVQCRDARADGAVATCPQVQGTC